MTTTHTIATKGHAIAAGEGERIWIVGDTMTFKATGESTAGSLLLLEILTTPGGGPPPHVHTREDEFWFVLDGTFEIRIADDVHTLGPGNRVRAPPHGPRLPQHGRDSGPGPRGLHAQRHGGLLPGVGTASDGRRPGATDRPGRDRPHDGGRTEIRRSRPSPSTTSRDSPASVSRGVDGNSVHPLGRRLGPRRQAAQSAPRLRCVPRIRNPAPRRCSPSRRRVRAEYKGIQPSCGRRMSPGISCKWEGAGGSARRRLLHQAAHRFAMSQ